MCSRFKIRLLDLTSALLTSSLATSRMDYDSILSSDSLIFIGIYFDMHSKASTGCNTSHFLTKRLSHSDSLVLIPRELQNAN